MFYILRNELSNEKAANDLIDAVENAIYVVIDDEGSDKIMEVRRMLYNRQDRENIVWRCNPDEELYMLFEKIATSEGLYWQKSEWQLPVWAFVMGIEFNRK